MNYSCLKDKIIKHHYISLCVSFLALFFLSCTLGKYNYFISAIYITIALIIFLKLNREDLFEPLGLFSLIWLGGIGITNLKLSEFQFEFSVYSWFIILLTYFMFTIGYILINDKKVLNTKDVFSKPKVNVEILYKCIIGLFLLCIISLLIEVLVLGFIPIFSNEMSAYVDFHISGLHYFTVSIVLVPLLSIIYYKSAQKVKPLLILMNVVSLIVPVIILSRQLLIFEILTFIILYNIEIKRLNIKKVATILIITITIFSLMSNLRNQDNAYMLRVAQLKYNLPSLLVQPYMYISMNFENLSYIISNFTSHTFGINILFPLFAFTNTKGYFDYSFRQEYVVTPNFNTTTFISDAYYDLGVIGVIIFALFVGIITSYIYKKNNHVLSSIVSSILVYCIIFSFFANWFSNPTIWFYIIILGIIGIILHTLDNSKIPETKKSKDSFQRRL